MKLTWWWTVINTDETFIVMILLLWIQMVLQCCNFTIFAGWINRKNKNTCKKKLSHTNGISDKLQNSHKFIDGQSRGWTLSNIYNYVSKYKKFGGGTEIKDEFSPIQEEWCRRPCDNKWVWAVRCEFAN